MRWSLLVACSLVSEHMADVNWSSGKAVQLSAASISSLYLITCRALPFLASSLALFFQRLFQWQAYLLFVCTIRGPIGCNQTMQYQMREPNSALVQTS